MIRVYVIDQGRKFFGLQWVDPATGKRVTKSSKKTKRREAERVATELEKRLNGFGFAADGSLPWSQFVDRYMLQHAAGMSANGERKALSVLAVFERTAKPRILADVTPGLLTGYAAALRSGGRSESTISSHLKTVKAVLNWAARNGMIETCPRFPVVSRGRSKLSRGRPLTLPEFVRMLRACRAVKRAGDPASWQHFLIGLWLSGLRLEESLELRWHAGRWHSLDFSGKFPMLRIVAEAEKGNADRLLPLTPDFARFIARTRQPSGYVFNPLGERGTRVGYSRACHVIADIGKAAGVVVDPPTGRTATAHDLRRTYGSRWAHRVQPVVLKEMMRHADISTTTKYYVDVHAAGLAETLWKGSEARLVNTSLNKTE